MNSALPGGKLSVVQLGVYPPPHGGVQTNVVAIHQRLRERGHRGFVISLSRHRQTGIENVFFPRTPLEVCRLLVTLPVNVAHFHIGGDITNRLAALAAFLSALPGRQTVLTLHSGGYPASVPGRRPLRLKAILAVFRKFDALVGVNPELRDFLASSGIAPGKTHLIEPFPSLTRLKSESAFQPALQAFCAAQKPLLVTVGLLEPEYDLPLQFAVLRKLRQTHPDAGLAIVGSGSLKDDLIRQIAAEPYNERILLAGDVPHPATIELIRRAAALLRTTLYDGDSIAIREALQLATPVVATDNGMRPPGVFLAPIGDADAVARQVLNVLATPRPQRDTIDGARSETDGIDDMLALYRSITST
jgi:glycosyltransferase involved in cell wall biosynthesis